MRVPVNSSSRSSNASSSGEDSSQEESGWSNDARDSYTAESSTSSVEVSGCTTESAGGLIRAFFSMEPEADMRAVPARVLLAAFGQVWSSSSPSTQQVPSTSRGKQQWFLTPEYDAFVSHNWGAGRLEKHLALLLAFNGRAALVMGILCGPLMGFLEVFFDFPEVTDWYDCMMVNRTEYEIRFRWWAEIVGCLVFMIVIWCWHLTEVCGRRRALFLDKLCIDQEDVRMKQMGIKSLPAYLNHTRMLLVLWSEAYLSRLWCVLELATWVYLKKTNMLFVPVMTAEMLCGFFCYMQLTGVMNSVYQYHHLSKTWHMLYFWLPIFVACAIAQVVLQVLMRSRLKLDKQLKSFDCRRAQCTDEKDREMILEQIRRWFGRAATTSLADAQGGADDAEAAHVLFNRVVRTTVYEQLHRVSGDAARLHYEWALLACLPNWWRWCDITAAAAEGHLPVGSVINIALHGSCVTFCYSPVLLHVFLWLTAWAATSKVFDCSGGVRRAACISVVSLATCTLMFASEVLANKILFVESWFITIAADAAVLLITVAIYSSRMRWRIWSWLPGDHSHRDDFVD